MEYDAEISQQEGIVSQLQNSIRQTRLPQRTIAWQHANVGATPMITQRVLVVRKQRKQMQSQVSNARTKIMSLRKAILGVE